jgi:hypothetical protein
MSNDLVQWKHEPKLTMGWRFLLSWLLIVIVFSVASLLLLI